MALISCTNFAYIINSIGNILNDQNKKKQEYRTKIAEINNYMKDRNVPLYL